MELHTTDMVLNYLLLLSTRPCLISGDRDINPAHDDEETHQGEKPQRKSRRLVKESQEIVLIDDLDVFQKIGDVVSLVNYHSGSREVVQIKISKNWNIE